MVSNGPTDTSLHLKKNTGKADTLLAIRKRKKEKRVTAAPTTTSLSPPLDADDAEALYSSMSRAAILCALVATSTTAAPTVNAPDEKGFSFGSGNVRCCLAAHRLRASPTSPHATPPPLFGLIPSEHRRWRKRLHDIDQRLHRRVL